MRSTCFMIVAVAIALCVGTAQAEVLVHYNFDADYTDSSTNDNHGNPLLNVSITNTSGEHVFGGGAAKFTTTRDIVQLSTQINFADEDAYSISFWARNLDSTGASGMVLGNGDTLRDDYVWIYEGDSIVKWQGTGVNASSASAPDDNWHHYVVVAGDYDGDASVDDISFYKDGAYLSTTNDLPVRFQLKTIGAGYRAWNNFDFEGQIDEVWIFDEALDAGQVGSLYAANAVPEPTTLGLLLCGIFALAGLRLPRRNS